MLNNKAEKAPEKEEERKKKIKRIHADLEMNGTSEMYMQAIVHVHVHVVYTHKLMCFHGYMYCCTSSDVRGLPERLSFRSL